MVTKFIAKPKILYDTDYHLWVLETVQQLKNREFSALDLENLIEEVEDLSRRDKRKLESLLMKLIEHLLIYQYWQAERERNQGHWQREIANFRKQIQRILEDSPSLTHHLKERLRRCYADGRDLAVKHSQLPSHCFPEEAIAPLEQVLDEDWLPS